MTFIAPVKYDRSPDCSRVDLPDCFVGFWPSGDLFIDARRIADIYAISLPNSFAWELLRLSAVMPLNLSSLVVLLSTRGAVHEPISRMFLADCRAAIRYFNSGA